MTLHLLIPHFTGMALAVIQIKASGAESQLFRQGLATARVEWPLCHYEGR